MSQPTPVEAFNTYPFDLDAEFQVGLQSILAGAPPEADRSAMEQQAKLFYFNRKTGLSLSPSDLSSSLSHPSTSGAGTKEAAVDGTEVQAHEAAPASAEDAPYPLSFAQLAELIQTNRVELIPNNDVIPSTVLEGQASESTLLVPRKPWETAAPAAQEGTQKQDIAQQ